MKLKLAVVYQFHDIPN